ncbi:hypothetical protein TNIN_15071 [Trichonephila inaurata madagascariensis]|uniref:Uncharacterized protein n=1 Tax=Trichonephila inaurata madagascariensis TaxID=2747483 RepID=A0A8X7C052_9ARAC|nr:hypothetical protein TNIN_15071 [Trichonephila inaurata madagascariensis]
MRSKTDLRHALRDREERKKENTKLLSELSEDLGRHILTRHRKDGSDHRNSNMPVMHQAMHKSPYLAPGPHSWGRGSSPVLGGSVNPRGSKGGLGTSVDGAVLTLGSAGRFASTMGKVYDALPELGFDTKNEREEKFVIEVLRVHTDVRESRLVEASVASSA